MAPATAAGIFGKIVKLSISLCHIHLCLELISVFIFIVTLSLFCCFYSLFVASVSLPGVFCRVFSSWFQSPSISLIHLSAMFSVLLLSISSIALSLSLSLCPQRACCTILNMSSRANSRIKTFSPDIAAIILPTCLNLNRASYEGNKTAALLTLHRAFALSDSPSSCW